MGKINKEIILNRKEFLTSPIRWENRLYKIWGGIIGRCTNPNNSSYPAYGGRGISVCASWKNDFWKFYDWAMENGYDDSLSIDRINNNRGYSPKNCRWATKKTQANNTRACRYIEINGVKLSMAQWAELTKLDYEYFRRILNTSVWKIKDKLLKAVNKYTGEKKDTICIIDIKRKKVYKY